MLICDRQWIAVEAISSFELALEVRSPEIIRIRRRGRDHSWMLIQPASSPLHHQSTACQEICRSTRHWPLPDSRISSSEHAQKFSRSPERMLAAKIAYEIRQLVIDTMRTVMWRPASILEPPSPAFFVSCNPLVTDPAADAISGAQFGHREAVAQRVAYKPDSLFHRHSLHPGHRPYSRYKA